MEGKDKKMEEKYSWKRTEEIEIDLADLLKRLCGQWKQIAACAMAAAVILGSYGWLKGRSVADADVPAAAAEEILLTEAQEQAVADAVQLNKEIQGLETYLENSVLMQIDPYHKARHIPHRNHAALWIPIHSISLSPAFSPSVGAGLDISPA